MMTFRAPFQPSPLDYPNHLAGPDCRPVSVSRQTGLLIALVALALVPRAMMVLRIPSINPDGVLYVQLAKALESGDLRTPFYDMALNVYPVILVGLHRLGLELVHPAALPSTRSDIYVLVRSDKNRHVAQVPRPSK